MAAKTTAVRKKTTRKKAPARRKKTSALSKLEIDLPDTWKGFESRVRRQLNRLEKDIDKAQSRYRRQATRVLRDASHRLGRLEAQGERGWKRLNRNARKEAVSVLHRLEKAVAPPKPRRKKKALR